MYDVRQPHRVEYPSRVLNPPPENFNPKKIKNKVFFGCPGPVLLVVQQNTEYICDSHIAVEIPYELPHGSKVVLVAYQPIAIM